jgi:chemotaxis protein methyltransferase CheR
VLVKAAAGVYGASQLDHIPKILKNKYFNRIRNSAASDDDYEAKAECKKRVVFKRLNLSKPPFPMPGPLDAVFCRNVMIYFDNAVRQGLVSEIERLLKPGGILFIGHSETLTGISTDLRIETPSVYRKPRVPRCSF